MGQIPVVADGIILPSWSLSLKKFCDYETGEHTFWQVYHRVVRWVLSCTLYPANHPTPQGVTVATFEDDTAILASSTDYPSPIEALQVTLDEVYHWSSSWKMHLSGEKTVNITFAPRPHLYLLVHLNSTIVPYRTTAKYL